MSNINNLLEKCYIDGKLDLRTAMENFSIDCRNLSINDIQYLESECRELRQKLENSEKVECFKTYRLFDRGWSDLAYFSLDEIEIVKKLANERVEADRFDFEIKKVSISKEILEGHIRDRKELESL